MATTMRQEVEEFELTNKDLRRIDMEFDSRHKREVRDAQAIRERMERVAFKRDKLYMKMADSSWRH